MSMNFVDLHIEGLFIFPTHPSEKKEQSRLLLSVWICPNTYLTKVSCFFITFCSFVAHFYDFSTFKTAGFLPGKKIHVHVFVTNCSVFVSFLQLFLKLALIL